MEEQGLVVVKDSFLFRFTNAIKKLIFRGKEKVAILEENLTDKIKIQEITDNNEFVQQEIQDARRAFRKYVINNKKNISTDILLYINEKIEENQQKIRQLIDINKDEKSLYEDILKMLENAIKDVEKFKQLNSKTGRYNVPIGVVGVECVNTKNAIKVMLKAISTRNAIVILHDKYNQYSTESLIMLIIKECLKNFYIDDNIIQMCPKETIDIRKLDNYVPIFNDDGNKDNNTNTIFIYQEDNIYLNTIQDEVTRLENDEEFKFFNIQPIKGDFGNIINYINNEKNCAVCMYTNSSQKAYKFINWVNSPNVFINTGVKSCSIINNNSDYYNLKYVLHKDVF